VLLVVLERRNVHHHVDFLRAEAQDVLGLILLYRGRFVAVRKPHHGSDEDVGAPQQLDGERDVMRLHGERRRAQPRGGFTKLNHLGPRRIGADDRVIEGGGADEQR
jgi:hypothetical protein